MRNNLSIKIVIALFIALTFLTPFYWILVDDNTPINSVEEGRELKPFPNLGMDELWKSISLIVRDGNWASLGEYTKRFSHQSYQDEFEAGVSDRFPLRMYLIKSANWVDRMIIQSAYLFVKDPAIPADSNYMIFVTRDDPRLIRRPVVFRRKEKTAIDKSVETYAELINQYPEIYFYVFYIQRLQDSRYHPIARFYKNADLGRSLSYFESKKPDRLNFGKLKFNSYEDINNFYRSDHHWDAQGVCKAYGILYSMLASHYPEITPQLDCAHYQTIPGVGFLGALARETLYPLKPEPFEIMTVQLPPHKIYVDGKEIQDNVLEKYLTGDFSKEKYVNHFQEIYGRNEEEPEYFFSENPARNLLIIGSSFRKPIVPLLASHYRYTYTLDLRNHPQFKLSEYLADHQVDDILILGESTVVFQKNEWKINP